MSIWTPSPEHVRTYRDNSLGSMGSVSDEGSAARWAMRDVQLDDGAIHEVLQWSLVGFRLHFIGGTGTAELALRVDHRDPSGLYDWTLRRWPKAGIDDDKQIVHVPTDEADFWGLYPFYAGDEMVLTWADPSGGVTRWAIEVFLAYVRLGNKIGQATALPGRTDAA